MHIRLLTIIATAAFVFGGAELLKAQQPTTPPATPPAATTDVDRDRDRDRGRDNDDWGWIGISGSSALLALPVFVTVDVM